MAKWRKSVQRLPKTHGWRAKPGYKIFVADRGAVRFDYPGDWHVQPNPEGGSIQFFDRPPPDDECRLEVSVIHLPPGVDFSGLTLRFMLEDAMKAAQHPAIAQGEIVEVKRRNMELAWVERWFKDPDTGRTACSRACLARGSNVQPFITLDFWPEDAERVIPVWDEVLRTLELGNYVDIHGRRLH